MSDRSSLQIIVYAVAPAHRAAVLDAILDEDMAADWGLRPPTELALGTLHGVHEASLGTSTELANRLLEEAPSAVFELWQDPHQVADGHYVAHVPGVGTHIADCDAQGIPHVALNTLMASLSACPDGMTVREWLASEDSNILGTAVQTALSAYKNPASASAA